MFTISLLITSTIEYTPSLYAPSANDYIITQNADTFYFLENITTPPKSKPINESGFTSEIIPIYEYGWPGHDRTCSQQLEEEEGLNMRNFYQNRVNLTFDDMYYHPVAPEEFWSTWEDIDSLQRAKVKVTLNPKYINTRTTNLYMPPGELITFEILPEAVGLITVKVNYHRQEVSLKDRYKYLQCTTVLTEPISTWGWPMGGAVTFEVKRNGFPLEINVSGCVIAPFFEYGVSDEKEWEEVGRNLKAPTAQLSNGAIQQMMPSNTIRALDRMDDGQAWLRSVWLRSQEVAPDNNVENTRYTCFNQLLIRYDNYVTCGVACAIVGANFVDHYTDWANGANVILNQKDGNPWGTIHEINHHHQGGWGFSDLDPALSEATNNVLNSYEYTYQNSQSGNRHVDSSLTPVFLRDHMETVHPYYLFFYDQGDYFREGEWDLIYHCLGYKAFKNYMFMNTNNSPYTWQEFSGYGRHILTLMDATGYDCFEFCNFYCKHLNRKSPKELIGDKWDAFYNAYIHHPAYHNYLHIMGCFYASGFVRNNERFETARAFKIYPILNTTFDFNKALKSFDGDKTYFGDFVFDRIESKRQSAWTEISKGVYTYKPVDDLTFIDEALAIYIDKTTNKETVCIIKLELKPSRKAHTVSVYNFTDNECKRSNEVDICYQNIKEQKLINTFNTDFSGIPSYNGYNITLITDIVAQPTKSGIYTVGANIAERGLLYFSSKPLTGDYFKDAPYFVLKKGWYQPSANFGDINRSVYINASEKLYIRLVVNNANNPTDCPPTNTLCRPDASGTIYIYETGTKESFGDQDILPDEWFQIQPPIDFAPSLIDFKYGNTYEGKKIIENPTNKWTANVSMQIKKVITLTNTDYDYSQGKQCTDCTDANVSEILVNGDETNEVRSGWWPEWEQQKFPHIYDVNFNGNETFDAIYLRGAYNQGYFGMNSTVSIYLNSKECSSDDIEDDDNLIWQGIYISKYNVPINLNREYTGKYLRIVVHNNTQKWKDGNPGMSSFSFISVGKYIYTTNYKAPRNCQWEVRKDGYYLNGRSFVGKEGDTYTYIPDEGNNQVAIVGDRFDGMGEANVYFNGNLVKVINSDDINLQDRKAMKFSSRSYMQILYVTPIFTNPPNITLEVISGEFRLTGFIVGSFNDSSSVHNGPMPTVTPTEYPQQTPYPTPTISPVQPTLPPIKPTEKPDFINGPTVDDSNAVTSDEIIFTKDGFKYGGNEIITTSIDKDIVLIKDDSDKITLMTETANKPSQDKYISVTHPNTTITIGTPENGNYGNGQIGIHPNSQNPIIQIPTTSVPLNIYTDSENTVSIEPTGMKEAYEIPSITIGKITSTNGSLKVTVPENTKEIEASEIKLYNNGQIASYAGEKLIDTIVEEIKLNEGSQSTILNVNIKEELKEESNSKLVVKGKATFNPDSVVSLTDTSSIEFGNSIVNGICKSLEIKSSNNKVSLLSNEVTLICGNNYDCESWTEKYSGNSQYPDSKCVTNENGEKCLVAFHDEKNNKPDKEENDNDTNKKNKILIIAVSCAAAAVVVIIIIVVSVVVAKKKKNTVKSEVVVDQNTIETNNNDEENSNNGANEIDI